LNKSYIIAMGSLLACLVACGDAGSAVHEESSQASDSTKSASTVHAGEESAKLGVDRWTIESDTAKGWNRSNEVVAEFHVNGETRTIQSVLPEAGSKDIDHPGNSTLTASTSAYLQAFTSDLASAVENAEETPKTADAQSIEKQSNAWYQGCYQFYVDCSAVATQGLFLGLWRYAECRMPTPVCGNAIALIVAR
jgi:hypothetical protein